MSKLVIGSTVFKVLEVNGSMFLLEWFDGDGVSQCRWVDIKQMKVS